MPATPRPVECNKGCGQLVYFDRTSENGWSQTGKMIPLQWDEEKGPTDVGHQCPNSDYNRRKTGAAAQTTTTREQRVPSTVEMSLGNQLDILAKVERLLNIVEQQTKMIFNMSEDLAIIRKYLKAQTGDPLNDDGDSLRENPEGDSE